MPTDRSGPFRGRGIALSVFVVLGVAVAAGAAAAPEYIPDRNIGVPVGAVAGVIAFSIGLLWDKRTSQKQRADELALRWSRLFAHGPTVPGKPKTTDRSLKDEASSPTPSPPSMIRRLAPDVQAVPFETTRYREIGPIRRWCLDGDPGRVWLLAGGPGSGKTRLAIRIADALRANRFEPWQCGWLGSNGVEGIRLAAEWEQPVLVIIDDADTRSDLGDVVSALHQGEFDQQVKALLIARDFGEWWTTLQKPFAFDISTDGRTTALGPLAADAPGQLVLARRAASAFAEDALVPVSDVKFIGIEPGTPLLVLHAAALEAVNQLAEGQQSAVDVTRVVDQVLDREHRVWLQRARHGAMDLHPQLNLRLLRNVLVLAMLIGARDETSGAALLRSVPGLQNATEDLVESLMVWLHMYDRMVGYIIRPHLPALFAEHLIAQALAADSVFAAAVAAAADNPTRIHYVLVNLARASTHTEAGPVAVRALLRSDPARLIGPAVEVARGGIGRIDSAIADVVAHCHLDRTTLSRLYEGIPLHTEALEETGIALAEALVEQTRSAPEKAELLTRVAERLMEAGRWTDAFRVAQRAVAVGRTSCADERYNVVDSLCVFALAARRMDRPSDAVAAAQEALALAQALPQIQENAIWQAAATHALAEGLAYSDRFEDGAREAQKAVNLYRDLADIDSPRFQFRYARSLSMLGECQTQISAFEDAVQTQRDMVHLLRALAKEQPDAHLRHLCIGLYFLSRSLSYAEQHEEAVDVVAEALRLLRASPSRMSAGTQNVLTSAVRTQLVVLRLAGRLGEAVVVGQEAVRRMTALAQSDRASSRFLADDLVQLSRALRDAQRPEDAVTTAGEAVRWCRESLKNDDADHHYGDLAISLVALARALHDTRRYDDSSAAAIEGKRILQRLIRDHPEYRYKSQLSVVQTLLADLGHQAD